MSGCYESLCHFWGNNSSINYLKQSLFQVEYKLAELQKHSYELEHKYEILITKLNENTTKIIKIDKKLIELESNQFMDDFHKI